ncbi:MAG TPA: ISKra4 family transposase [Candidatus Methylomirabilis sp.]|nr:ISKra4 family transposase [Candidatus Methylomirabilis sp.]
MRQNIGCYTPMELHTGGLVMIITPEQAALKAQERFDHLLDLVRQASHDGERIDTVERDLMRHLLALGHDLLALFIAKQGDGDLGPTMQTSEGRALHRLPEAHTRRYVSIFGEFTLPRVVYGTREGQKIECVPLDQRLGLPEGDFSYVLEDWGQRFCLKESFAEAGRSLEMLLGLNLGRRTLEQMNRTVASYALAFRAAIDPPSPEEEGTLLVVTGDGKGVPMRKPEPDGPQPHHRPTKGEKRNKKQMACVGAVYSIEPFVRTADDILDEVLRDKRSKDRPKPRHKHVWAEMIREVEGQPPVTAKDGLFCQLFDELAVRNLGQNRPVVCLMDGERSLWDAQEAFFPEAVGVLDLFHVLERVWGVAHCVHKEGSDEAEQFVEGRLRDLLEGRVGSVIEGFRRRLTEKRLRGNKRQVVRSAIEYLENNRDHLKYDEYLAAGYPIGSGVAEGACRHLVKDRLEQTGMRWTVSGAQAMLHVRALYLNDQWDDYLEFRVEQEQERLYQRDAA